MQFSTEDDLVDYVEREISEALPSGWSSTRTDGNQLIWKIVPDNSILDTDYRLRVTADGTLFVLEYGNTDAGAFGLRNLMLNAKVFDAQALYCFSLADAIKDVMNRYKPNEWGFS